MIILAYEMSIIKNYIIYLRFDTMIMAEVYRGGGFRGTNLCHSKWSELFSIPVLERLLRSNLNRINRIAPWLQRYPWSVPVTITTWTDNGVRLQVVHVTHRVDCEQRNIIIVLQGTSHPTNIIILYRRVIDGNMTPPLSITMMHSLHNLAVVNSIAVI